MSVNGSPELLIVMAPGATAEHVSAVVHRLEDAGVRARVSRGREATVIGVIADRELLATLPLEGYSGVAQVVPILKPYKLVSREFPSGPTVIEARGRRIGGGAELAAELDARRAAVAGATVPEPSPSA